MAQRYILLAAIGLSSLAFASPAHAGALDDTLNLIDNVSRLVDGQNNDWCMFHDGVRKVTCRARQIEMQVDRTRRLARQALPTNIAKPRHKSTALEMCASGQLSACAQIDLAPQQARYVLDQSR